MKMAQLMQREDVSHSPNLNTVLMVEEVLKSLNPHCVSYTPRNPMMK